MREIRTVDIESLIPVVHSGHHTMPGQLKALTHSATTTKQIYNSHNFYLIKQIRTIHYHCVKTSFRTQKILSSSKDNIPDLIFTYAWMRKFRRVQEPPR